jgi:hypothetical protein
MFLGEELKPLTLTGNRYIRSIVPSKRRSLNMIMLLEFLKTLSFSTICVPSTVLLVANRGLETKIQLRTQQSWQWFKCRGYLDVAHESNDTRVTTTIHNREGFWTGLVAILVSHKGKNEFASGVRHCWVGISKPVSEMTMGQRVFFCTEAQI